MHTNRKSMAAVLAFALASAAWADDKAAAAIQKQETAATSKCAAELVKCAKALLALKAPEEARDELRLAVAIAPQDPNCRKEYAKLLAARGDAPEAAAQKISDARAAAHAVCVAALAPVLTAWDKAGRAEEFARLATTTVACFERPEALAAFDLVWYEDYVVWAKKADVERWQKGDEVVDGAWVAAEKVKDLDAAHANWTTPWTISDGVHEVRTSMPLRAAKRVSEYVRAYRRFVVDYFAGEWEWRQPKGVLPVYLTATQADFQARMRAFDPGVRELHASAIYVQKTGGLSPVFVTFEPNMLSGGKVTIDWPSLLRDVRHETAHQILYESSMAQGAPVLAAGVIDWVSEGVANFLGAHRPSQGRWRLARVASEPYGTGFEPASFAWTRGNFERIAPLAKYVEVRGNITDVEGYYSATTLAYFFLVGEERRYRASYVKLVHEVHMARGGPKTFAECFGKADMAKMQEEWKAFVDGISIEK